VWLACNERQCGGTGTEVATDRSELPDQSRRRGSPNYTYVMIRQIAPVFFTADIPAAVCYYKDKLGFECLGTWQDPPVYAILARDGHAIHFRCAHDPTSNPDKYADELLDAYLFVEDADALYGEYLSRGVDFTRGLANMPWQCREFVVKDCDGRLLAFAANV
jgi:uncharacterized glyoxalase superfamily protein PhnB